MFYIIIKYVFAIFMIILIVDSYIKILISINNLSRRDFGQLNQIILKKFVVTLEYST